MATLSKARLAELRQQHGAVKAVRAADEARTTIALRRFAEDEAIAYADKRAAAATPGEREIGDYTDDGTQELLAAVVWPETAEGRPDVAAVRAFLGRYPAFRGRLDRLAQELGGWSLASLRDDASVLPAEGAGDLIGLRADETPIVLRRLSEMRYRFLEREGASSRVPYVALAAAAKEHLVSPTGAAADALWAAQPFLSILLGLRLRAAASVEAEDFEGES